MEGQSDDGGHWAHLFHVHVHAGLVACAMLSYPAGPVQLMPYVLRDRKIPGDEMYTWCY